MKHPEVYFIYHRGVFGGAALDSGLTPLLARHEFLRPPGRWYGRIELERLSVGRKSCVMKILLALCFTALCLAAHGQTPKPLFTKAAWRDYIAITKKIAQLDTKMKFISLETLEKKGLTRLQCQAQKISSDEAHQAELEADQTLASKVEPLQKEMAQLRAKQQELDTRHAMPAAFPFTPKPAKKPTP